MRLGSSNPDSLVGAIHDVNIEIRILLLVRRQRTIAFDVRHGTANNKVSFVHLGEKGEKPCVIPGAVFLVDFVRHGMQRVQRIHANAALKARAGQLSQSALHFVLHDQIAC